MIDYNTIVLGAGISGISCAIYLKRAGIKVLLVEGNIPGGQLNKASVIENYPGYVSIGGSDLSMMLLNQVQSNDIDMVYDMVSDIDYDKKIVTIGVAKYSYKYLVIATGRRERVLGLEQENSLIGRGISLCATCDGALYKDKYVVVVGGGASAVSEALYLSNIVNKVYLVYRGNKLKAEDVMIRRVKDANNIEVIYEANVVEYKMDDSKLCGVKLDSGREIVCDGVFLAIGYVPNSEVFIGKKNDGYIVVDEYGKTSISNVYACGDVIEKKVYQLVTASSEGVLVASSIIRNNNS